MGFLEVKEINTKLNSKHLLHFLCVCVLKKQMLFPLFHPDVSFCLFCNLTIVSQCLAAHLKQNTTCAGLFICLHQYFERVSVYCWVSLVPQAKCSLLVYEIMSWDILCMYVCAPLPSPHLCEIYSHQSVRHCLLVQVTAVSSNEG